MVIIEETWRTRSWLASRTKSNGEGEQSSKASGNRDESSSEKRNDIPCRYKKWKNPWCKFLHPPVSKLQVWDWMQIWKNMFLQTCWGWGENPARSQRAVVRTDPLHYWRSLHNWVVYLKILNRESLFYVKTENWDQNAPSSFPRALVTKGKFGTETVQCKELSQSVNLMSSLRAETRERSHEETLHQERFARRVASDLAKNTYTLKNADKATFYTSSEATAIASTSLQNLQKNENS